MKSFVAIALTAILTTALAAIPVPRGTSGAIVGPIFTNETRIYHQVETSLGIKEVSVGLPPGVPFNDGFIWNGPTRKNTPLAAISWSEDSGKTSQIRVYFVTEKNTLGEIAYFPTGSTGGWQPILDTGFGVQDATEFLYATKIGQTLIVGYANKEGSLSEAYYVIGTGAGWKSYTL